MGTTAKKAPRQVSSSPSKRTGAQTATKQPKSRAYNASVVRQTLEPSVICLAKQPQLQSLANLKVMFSPR